MKTTLLVLAAGMGSRYGGLKQLDEVGPMGECLLDYSIYDAVEAGFNEVVILIRPDIEEEFREKIGNKYQGVSVKYAYQTVDQDQFPERKKPWGTAHAILSAWDMIDNPFAVINADDYYGKIAYQKIHKFLVNSSTQEDDYAIAGYRIENTLSENGSVSRGICELNGNGYLKKIYEARKVQRENGAIVNLDRNEQLPGSTLVSMNIWGLKPSIFPILERGFKKFLEQHGQDPKAEYLIPEEMSQKIHSGQIRVHVFDSESNWFGITYKEDKPLVQDCLLTLSLKSYYPIPLW